MGSLRSGLGFRYLSCFYFADEPSASGNPLPLNFDDRHLGGFQKRYRWLMVLSALYALSYTAFHVLIGLSIGWFIVIGWVYQRWEWRIPVYTTIGAAIGLVVHPHFPSNLEHLGDSKHRFFPPKKQNWGWQRDPAIFYRYYFITKFGVASRFSYILAVNNKKSCPFKNNWN